MLLGRRGSRAGTHCARVWRMESSFSSSSRTEPAWSTPSWAASATRSTLGARCADCCPVDPFLASHDFPAHQMILISFLEEAFNSDSYVNMLLGGLESKPEPHIASRCCAPAKQSSSEASHAFAELKSSSRSGKAQICRLQQSWRACQIELIGRSARSARMRRLLGQRGSKHVSSHMTSCSEGHAARAALQVPPFVWYDGLVE